MINCKCPACNDVFSLTADINTEFTRHLKMSSPFIRAILNTLMDDIKVGASHPVGLWKCDCGAADLPICFTLAVTDWHKLVARFIRQRNLYRAPSINTSSQTPATQDLTTDDGNSKAEYLVPDDAKETLKAYKTGKAIDWEGVLRKRGLM